MEAPSSGDERPATLHARDLKDAVLELIRQAAAYIPEDVEEALRRWHRRSPVVLPPKRCG